MPGCGDKGDQVSVIVTASNGATESQPVEVVLTVANSPPRILGPAKIESWIGESLNVQVEAFDPDGDMLIFSAEGLPEGFHMTTLGRIVGEHVGEGPADWALPIRIRASDGEDTSTFVALFLTAQVVNVSIIPPVGFRGQLANDRPTFFGLRLDVIGPINQDASVKWSVYADRPWNPDVLLQDTLASTISFHQNADGAQQIGQNKIRRNNVEVDVYGAPIGFILTSSTTGRVRSRDHISSQNQENVYVSAGGVNSNKVTVRGTPWEQVAGNTRVPLGTQLSIQLIAPQNFLQAQAGQRFALMKDYQFTVRVQATGQPGAQIDNLRWCLYEEDTSWFNWMDELLVSERAFSLTLDAQGRAQRDFEVLITTDTKNYIISHDGADDAAWGDPLALRAYLYASNGTELARSNRVEG
ncbi:MAG: hypothetical protein RMI91_15120 [Gemmatales bacterium]|nr:hypothetical protein [Gemmatales bacterium]MDW7995976.1 hypothetical protein [Gemmatales bacterium]